MSRYSICPAVSAACAEHAIGSSPVDGSVVVVVDGSGMLRHCGEKLSNLTVVVACVEVYDDA